MKRLSIRMLPFGKRLFLSVIVLFIAFSTCFVLFQYQREKVYKSDVLNIQLQSYNSQLYDFVASHGTSADSLLHYVHAHVIPDLRVTLITPEGKVVFDNTEPDLRRFGNHASRKEIQDALIYGSGYSISRHSESKDGQEYFYSARYYPQQRIIIRSALPYSLNLNEHLKADSTYLWFTVAISLVLAVFFYQFTQKLGKSITKLREFAQKADRNAPIDMEQTFPNNELGDRTKDWGSSPVNGKRYWSTTFSRNMPISFPTGT